MDSKTRAFLRGKAGSISPTVIIGKEGISENLILQIDSVLETRELVKISCLDSFDADPKYLINELADMLNAESVQAIGRKMVIYRYSRKCKEHALDGFNDDKKPVKKKTK